ncbi:hypothetical protein BKH43_06830 [Helicobacter sp. 13S00401-1]|uniref:ATP-binding protein n=1 Tax=Helicobacter sp. 13S00401-1 TaxID=1905758 RepID=UPI000BA6CDE9|nr:hypothetical protein BKH43_06830 [Helicobacter sp. 13S00401-1]
MDKKMDKHMSMGKTMEMDGLKIKEIDGLASPESVFVSKHHVYVTNVGKFAPIAKDGDGFVSLLDHHGNVIQKKWITGLDGPKGMNMIGDTLYMVDVGVIRGFNVKTKKEVFKLPVKGSIFLNDIAVENDHTLLVSDTGTGLILKVDVKTKKYSTLVKIDPALGGPNGLVLDGDELYIAGYDASGKNAANLMKYNMKTKKLEVFSGVKGELDGLQKEPSGSFLVSDWNGLNFTSTDGKLYRVQADGSYKEIPLPVKLRAPADIFLHNGVLWIPEMLGNKVLRIEGIEHK